MCPRITPPFDEVKRGTIRQRHLASCPRLADGSFASHKCKGPWQFMVDADRAPTAPRRQVGRAGFPTKRDAQAALQRFLEDERYGIDVTNDATVGDYLEHWLAGKRALRPSTLKSYREHVHLYLLPSLGEIRLRDLRAGQVDRLLNDLAKAQRVRAISSATLRRIHATLRGALNDAVGRRLLPYNPAMHVELPTEHREGVIVWSPEQVNAFLRQTSSDRLYALFHLVTVTGLRRGEAVGLRWVDVDSGRSQIRVAQQVVQLGGRLHFGPPKTRRGARTIPLDAVTAAVIAEHAKRQEAERRAWGDAWTDAGLVFTREDGNPLSPEQVSRRFKLLAHRAGVPVIRFHDLRHTSASLALAAGVAIKVVSDRLGHSTSGITADLYTHVTPAVARDAADAIARTISGSADGADVARMLPQDEVFGGQQAQEGAIE